MDLSDSRTQPDLTQPKQIKLNFLSVWIKFGPTQLNSILNKLDNRDRKSVV